MMKPVVDKNKCTGCGVCIALCPDVFELGEDGKSIVKNASACGQDNNDCKTARDSCPEMAISLE